MKKENNKIWKILKDKKTRSIILIVFYCLLFLSLIFYIRIKNNLKDSNNSEENIEKIESVFELQDYLENKNYSYEYTLKVDNNTYKYTGKRYIDKEEFVFQNGLISETYQRNKSDIYKKEKDKYVKVELPYHYFNYFDSDLVGTILEKSIFDSKNNLYEISNGELQNIIGNQEKNNEQEGINTIEIIYGDNNIVSIIMDLTNYVKNLNETDDLVILELKYRDFQKIKDFSIN